MTEGIIKNENEKFNYIMKLLAIAFILIVCNLNTFQLYAPISRDENGYYSQAALLAGLDWSGACQQLDYYSYGIGLFVFWLFKIPLSATIIYRIIIIINSILLCISLFFIQKIIIQMYPDISTQACIIASLVSIALPSNVAYTDYFLAEVYIVFLFSASVYFICNWINKRKLTYYLLFIFTCSLLFFVHQRSLGVIISAVICSAYCIKKSPKLIVHVALGFLLMLGIFFLGMRYKSFSQSVLWGANDRLINDFSGQMADIYSEQISLELVYKLLMSYAGKIWYLIVESFGLILIGILICAKKTTNKHDKYHVFYLYIMMTFIFELSISVWFMRNPIRSDHIIFGRYIDAFISPIIAIGIVGLIRYKDKKIFNYIFGLFIVVLLLGELIEKYFGQIIKINSRFDYGNNVGIYSFIHKDLTYRNGLMIFCTVFSVFLLSIFWYLVNTNRYHFALLAILVLFIYHANLFHEDRIIYQDSFIGEINVLESKFDSHDRIGYLYDTLQINTLQVLNPHANFVLLDENNYKDVDYIILFSWQQMDYISKNFSTDTKESSFTLLKKGFD